jgi:sugar fermentation stimulation protein A
MVGEGSRAVMLYLVQRQDSPGFSVAADIDPIYADALERAVEAGVEVLCYACAVSTEAIEVTRRLAFHMRGR